MTTDGQHFITRSDMGAAVAFLRSLADDDLDGMTIAVEAIENPWAVLGQFGSCLIDYARLVHDLGVGPSLDETLTAWGLETARFGEDDRA